MGTISATFYVAGDIDPEITDPMELLADVIDTNLATNTLELVEAEWLEE